MPDKQCDLCHSEYAVFVKVPVQGQGSMDLCGGCQRKQKKK